MNLTTLVSHADRKINKQWLRDELFAIRTVGLEAKFTELLESGKKYTNPSNSAVAWVLGITDEKPKKQPNIIIASSRIEPPDIDTDIEDRRLDDVRDYLTHKWKHVARISTMNTYACKGTLRDLCRVFAVPLDEVNAVAKLFDTLEEFLETSTPTVVRFRDKYPEIVRLVKKYEGRWRYPGIHAAGVVIANQPLEDILPMESRAIRKGYSERNRVTAYDMDDCAKIGLIKMDWLALRTLSVVHDCIDLIKEYKGIDIDWTEIPVDTPEVIDEFAMGHTVGVFQADAIPYTRHLKRLKPDNFTDLIASNSLVRPGALLTAEKSYIARKDGKQAIPKDHPIAAEITKDTYGHYIYQEQLIEALVKLGGFSWPEADTVRKIIAKKQNEEKFKPYEEKWLEGASQTVGPAKAAKMWKDFLKFAGYAFNKSHSVEYSIFMSRTMWLKYYYPTEYMLALMKNEPDNKKITTFILECRRLGIPLLMPDVNKSGAEWTIEGKAIRYGLATVKKVGIAAAEHLMERRPFDSYEDLSTRIERRKCNSAVLNNLGLVGAFDSFDDYEKPDEDIDLYELMGFPQQFAEIETPINFPITPVSQMEGDGFKLFKAIVKSVEFKRNITKIDLEDDTGIDVIWTSDTEATPKEGSVCLVGVYARDLVGHTTVAEFNEKFAAEEEMSKFERLLLGNLWGNEKVLFEHNVGELDEPRALIMPLSIREFKIKRGPNIGKKMAHACITDGKTIEKLVLFTRTYSQILGSIRPWEPIVIKPVRTKDNTLTIEQGGFITAENLMKRKGLLL